MEEEKSRGERTLTPEIAERVEPSIKSYDIQSPQQDGSKEQLVDVYPDGGLRAWLIVTGAVFSTLTTFGLVNSWGVFQSYYELDILKDSDPSAIAWIGSIQYALVFLPGLVVGRLFDLGHFKIPYAIATVLLVVSTFLVAECKEYWQFLLCQGIATGLGCGIMFGPTMSTIGQWFKKRRGLVLGLSAAGASVGGTIFPIAARRLIPQVGFPWTMRILGFIQLAGLTIANLTLTRRLPPVNARGGLFNPRAFKNMAYSVYCLSGFMAYLGLYTVLTYIDVSASTVGISPEFSFYLVSIANAASGFGRYAAGILADRLGAINIMAPMMIIAAILTFAWPFVKNEGGYVAVAIIYGFSSGSYVSTFLTPVFELGEIEDVGRRTGMTFTLVAIGALVGPPISGAINHATGNYEATGYYAGSVIVLSTALMILTKYLALGSLRGKF